MGCKIEKSMPKKYEVRYLDLVKFSRSWFRVLDSKEAQKEWESNPPDSDLQIAVMMRILNLLERINKKL